MKPEVKPTQATRAPVDEFEELWVKSMPVDKLYAHSALAWPGVMSLEKSITPERIGKGIEIRVSLRAGVVLFRKGPERMIVGITNFSTIPLPLRANS